MVPYAQETRMDEHMKPEQADLPNFAAWSLENLSNFATDAYVRMQQQEAAIEQLRLDLRRAMQELRKYQDDWK